jgi:hypothetical protein
MPTKTKSYKIDYSYAMKRLKEFNNYIEIEDFRHFLLMVLNMESGPEGILSQLGMAPKGKTILPYDPEKKMYYAKVMAGMSMNNQLTIYIKTEKKTDKLVNKAESPIITDTLTSYECKNMLPPKFVLLCPRMVDYSDQAFTENAKPKPFASAIESLFVDLMDFIVVQNVKYLFFLQGEGDEPDILFTINLSYDPMHSSINQFQYFDVYMDPEHKLRGYSFIWVHEDNKENAKLDFLKEIKDEFSHSDIFNSSFTIIVPVKSFKVP